MAPHMKQKRTEGAKTQSIAFVRASISFPLALYATLEETARQKKVSLAWIVRDAAEKYILSEKKERRGGRSGNTGERSTRLTAK